MSCLPYPNGLINSKMCVHCQLDGCNTMPYSWPMNSEIEPVAQLTATTCSS